MLLCLDKEVQRYNDTFVKNNRAYGELGHPDGPTVNLDKVSHMVTSLEPDGKNFIGEAKVMSTPMGEIVKNIIKKNGIVDLLGRGLKTRIITNGIQGILFTGWWKYIEETYNN